MSRWTSFARTVFVVMSLVCVPASVCGDEPDLKALAAKLPVLSPETEGLRSFSLWGQAHPQEGLTIHFHVAWAAPHEAGALVTVGDEVCAPVMFSSQGKLLLVDYLREQVSLNPGFAPMLKVGITDTDSISFNLGSSTTPKLDVDLGVFLKDLGGRPVWTRQADGKWHYENGSKTGNTRVVADFDVSHAYPLRKLQIIPSDKERPFLVLEDFAINEPMPKFLRSFPAADAKFPDDLVVETKTFTEDKKMAGRIDVMKKFMASLLATAAIEHEGLRELIESFGKVDWKQADVDRRKYAPQLMKMLGPDGSK